MPIVGWRVGDDSERCVKHIDLPFRVFNDDCLPTGLRDDEMDRSREAKRGLDDGDDADLVNCRSDLIDGREVGQEILSEIRRGERLRRFLGLVSLVAGKVRMIKEPDVEALLIHAFDDEILSDSIDSDHAILARPRQAGLAVGRVGFIHGPARHDFEPRHEIERPPFERAPKHDGAIARFQRDAGAGGGGGRVDCEKKRARHRDGSF